MHVDSELNFKRHIQESIAKSNRTLMAIKRTIASRQEGVVKTLFTVLVRPHLEYCNQAIIIKNKADMTRIEQVQRRATKMATSLQNYTYEERLAHLKLQSLTDRRERGDVIQVYKYKHGLSNGDHETLLPPVVGRNRQNRGHHMKIKRVHCRTDRRRQSFTQRVIGPWNTLDERTVSAPTLNCFKSRLDREWSHKWYRLG